MQLAEVNVVFDYDRSDGKVFEDTDKSCAVVRLSKRELAFLEDIISYVIASSAVREGDQKQRADYIESLRYKMTTLDQIKFAISEIDHDPARERKLKEKESESQLEYKKSFAPKKNIEKRRAE